MKNIFSNKKGMNIVGQGTKIILSIIPFIAISIICQFYFPEYVSLPEKCRIIEPAAYVLLIPGIFLWGTGLIQLLLYFPKGKLITNGAYSICRNPIYSSCIWFIFPAIFLITLVWLYLLVSFVLLLAVYFFIRLEEAQLLSVFGDEYAEYLKKVHRVVPFVRPRSK